MATLEANRTLTNSINIVISSKRGRSHKNVGSFRDDDFAYKHFENKLKFLLSATYGISKNKMYKWEFIIEFLKEKNIGFIFISFFKKLSK